MASPTTDQNSAGFQKMRILVAENESPVCFSVSQCLADLGHEVNRVQTIEGVIHALRHGAVSFLPYRLLIIDEDLLGVDGGQVLMNIRQSPGNQYFRVILLTSIATTQVESGIFKHIDACLRKPIREESVHAAIREALNSREAHSAKRRILIVEDDVLSLELMKILLTKNGCAVTLAANGLEALEACARTPFDLIFMDLQMPDMDGFTTASKIRDMGEHGRCVPIIALTASNLAGDAYSKFNGKFTRMLAKPFEIATILCAIEEHTGKELDRDIPIAHEKRPPFVNVPEALRHFGLDQELFRQIFKEFQASLPGRLAEMEEAFFARDLTSLARIAHNLKGVAANVGAMQLSEASARLDEQSNLNDAEHIPGTLEEIRTMANMLEDNATYIIEEHLSSTSIPMREK